MSQNTTNLDTRQAKWARFRFSIIGPLLAAPPENGELQKTLSALASKTWRHPITALPATFGVSTIERWFYQARKNTDPVNALRTKRRSDADHSRGLSTQMKSLIRQQHKNHPSWSYQLHVDNLKSLVKDSPEFGTVPSYNTVRRYMKTSNLCKQHHVRKKNTAGAMLAAERLETREVRSFEVDHVHALWHLDFHHCSRSIITKDGKWHKPLLLAILDDRSRLICHAQWYLDETAETLVHGVIQAILKRGLPRALMSDNGAAMTSGEFTQGLSRLGILHQTTLPYSPYQNAKQEVFWAQVEGRLMAMLENEKELSLSKLNEATIAWVEYEYHKKIHSEIQCTPYNRYINDPNLGRLSPETQILKNAFCTQAQRTQRKSDGTFSLNGKRFEVPSQYRHIEKLIIHYASWDLSKVSLFDVHSNQRLCTLYPQDKSVNASGLRRTFKISEKEPEDNKMQEGIAPLLKDLIAQHAATGLPPAYIPKGEEK